MCKFDELSREAQERAVQEYVETMDIREEMYHAISAWEEMLHDEGWLEPNIYFDLSGSQGAGACFEFTGIDFMKLWDFNKHPISKEMIDSIEVEMSAINNGRGCHEYSVSFSFDIYPIDNSYNELSKYDVEGLLQDVYRNRCCVLFANLQMEWESLTSFETISDIFMDNDYEFTKHGRLI